MAQQIDRGRDDDDDDRGSGVALLHWGSVIEDFLDPLGVSLDAFRTEMTGGWMFGYLDAMRRNGVDARLVCFSRDLEAPIHTVHEPTGTPLLLLPTTATHRTLRRLARSSRVRWGRQTLDLLAEYAATPPRRLARALNEIGCGVVLCQEYENPRFDVCVLLGRRTGRTVFATYQGANRTRTSGTTLFGLERWLRRRSIAHADGLIVASGAEAARITATYHYDPAKIAPIGNPVDLPLPMARADARRILGIPPELTVVAWHGRVEIQRKGLDVLLETWQRVRAQRPDAPIALRLLGSGSDDGELRRRLEALGDPTITWIDAYVHDRARIHAFLTAADVYLFASPHEGFAVAPLEAMAAGLAVVATAAQGIAELLEGDDPGGVVVPVGDTDALARELCRLIDDVERAQRLGAAARRRVESTYSVDAIGAALATLLTGTPSDAS